MSWPKKLPSNGLSFMDESIRAEYFEHVRRKMDELANLKEMMPEEIYREVLKQLTLLMDRDINIRHAAWDVDIGVEYYRHIFK